MQFAQNSPMKMERTRRLFDELKEGFDALPEQRVGKRIRPGAAAAEKHAVRAKLLESIAVHSQMLSNPRVESMMAPVT